jgi:hypothetical protein
LYTVTLTPAATNTKANSHIVYNSTLLIHARRMPFELRICTPSALRSLVETVAQVLSEASFTVVNEDDFRGLRLNSIDHTTVCMVSAQFNVPETDITGSGEFCVKTTDLITCLQAIDNSCVLRISGSDETDGIEMRAMSNKRTSRRYTIARIHREVEDIHMTDMPTTYQVHIKGSDLVGFLNVCKRRKYDNVTLRIQQVPSTDGRVDRFFTMFAAGDNTTAEHTDCQWGASRNDSDLRLGADVAAAREFNGDVPDGATRMYEEHFSRDYLSKFCKNMPSNEEVYSELGLCGTGKPLVLHIDLGVERSHVRFVLASMVDEM